MTLQVSSRLLACGLAGALAVAGAAQAQDRAWQSFVSVTPVFEGKGSLDGGGDVSAWNAVVRAGFSGAISPTSRAGLTFNYGYSSYSFSDPVAFGGVAPWGSVRRYGVAAPLIFGLEGGWALGVAPSVDWIHETGADESESIQWGAVLSATRIFADGNRIGFGLGVFERLEKTSYYPLILVDWKIGDRWRVVNPLPSGPTGPAGLELDYRFDNGWNLGLGAALRSIRFRLSEDGPVPNGIGEERGVPVFLRATRGLGDGMTLHLYAGVITSGQLRVEDSAGNRLREVDLGTTPIFGLTFSARF
jgi:hypothetical protein